MDPNDFNEFNGPPQDRNGDVSIASSNGGNPEGPGSRVGMHINLEGDGDGNGGGSRRRSTDPDGNFPWMTPSAERSTASSHSDKDMKAEEQLAKLMKNSFLDALKEAFVGEKKAKSSDYHSPADRIQTASGLSINIGGARTEEDMQRARKTISRGEGISKEKLLERLCVKLDNKFSLTDYGKLMNPDSDFDVASMTLQNQVVIDDFKEFVEKVDALDIFKIPEISLSDFGDIRLVMSARSHINLLNDHQAVTMEIVRRHQRFVNLQCDPVEAESSKMCKDVLKKSTEGNLLLRVTQTFDNLHKAEQGGLTFFKIIMDEAYKSSFESKQGLLTWMKSFDVRNYDGENVAVATSHFKAVLKALGDHAPPEPVRTMLKGLSKASNLEFQTLCQTQSGILDTVIYKRQVLADKITPAQEVDEFAGIVVGRFTPLSLDMAWSGHAHKGSVFKASLSKTSTEGAFVADTPKDKLPFKEWWDQQVYHDDLGARERPYNQRNPRPNKNNRIENRTRGNLQNSRRDQRDRKVSFKSDAAKSKFKEQYRQSKQRIYQALADAVTDEDREFLVNLADGDGAEDEGFESAVEEVEDDGNDEEDAMAHAAISIDSLLNW